MYDAGSVRRSGLRSAVAVVVGLACACVIWVAAPWNNLLLGAPNVTDSYLPVIVVFLLLVIVLGINPLLAGLGRGLALDRRQLALILGMMLMACTLPGYGVMHTLPYMVGHAPRSASENAIVAEAYDRLSLPGALFPDRVGYGQCSQPDAVVGDLRADHAIPWRAWLRPLAAWGSLLVAAWMMMLGLGMIVLPQWQQSERLAFPLLTVQRSLIEPPAPGGLIGPLFKSRLFWIAALAVLGIHAVNGLAVYFPDRVPEIPLQWSLRELFSEPPFHLTPGYIHTNRVYFMLIGLAFFMPGRIGFSIWFFLFAYGFWRAFAPLNGVDVNATIGIMDDHRLGAVLMLAVIIVYVGREHWLRVARSMVFDCGRTTGRDRFAGWAFVIGLAGMFAWLMWVGVQWNWGLLLVAFVVVVSLVTARLAAETGMPLLRVSDNPMDLMNLASARMISPWTAYFAVAIGSLFAGLGSRVNPTAMEVHALALSSEDDRPGPTRRVAVLMLLLMVVGLVVCGAVHLNMMYRQPATLDGAERPFNGEGRWQLGAAAKAVIDRDRLAGTDQVMDQRTYYRPAQLLLGAAAAGLLYLLCLASPRWPLHPLGFLLIDGYFGHELWASVLIGWLAKMLIVRFGGSSLYRRSRNVFLGLIVGEVLAVALWALVAAALCALGEPYCFVQVLPR